MFEFVNYLKYTLLIGCGATVFMDIAAILRRKFLGVIPADYGLVGRWILYIAHGHFHHDSIGASPAVRGERLIGWISHYLIGVVFAGVLMAIWGVDWVRYPTLAPALLVGVGSVAAPFLLMQPGMGAGIAASRTPNPPAARLRSMITHGIFGVGLYVAGLATKILLL